MTKGRVDYAIRQSLNNFDNWNDATGVFEKFSTYYHECQFCIIDAVKIGIMAALDIPIYFDDDGKLIDKQEVSKNAQRRWTNGGSTDAVHQRTPAREPGPQAIKVEGMDQREQRLKR